MAFNSTPQDIIEQNINGLLDIHNSWKRVPLALVSDVKNGFAFKSTSFNNQGEGERLIRIRDVLPGDTKTYYSGSIPDDYWVKPDDIVVGMDGDFNLAWWRSSPALLNQRVCRLDITSQNYIKRFFYRLLPGYLEAVNLNTSSTTVKHLSSKSLNELLIPLPPLAEQKVIADKLDTLLAQVENTKARLERIPQILKRFRQSVLAAAVSGRLTEEWRAKNFVSPISMDTLEDNYKVPDEFHGYGIPETWVKSPIGNFCSFQQGMQIAKSTRHQSSGPNRLPILRIGNYANKFTGDVDYIEVDENSLIAEASDLILTRTGETRGRVLTGFKGVFHNNTFRINFNEEIVLRGYLFLALNETLTQNYILDVSGRSAQPDLTHKKFGPCPIALPPFEEQIEIVRRVDQLFAHADRIEQQVNNALARVNNLTQSILAKAFRGELTEQWRRDNPELISGENSATALLERIKAERAAIKPAKKTRNQKATA